MRTFPTLSAVLVAASLLLLPGATQAQKALVYCPPTDNATCATLVTTLSATGGYPGGVDRAYDGTAGSVDLKTADLFPYTVFFVPSLSDGEAGTPYALLRDATVAGRLRAALIGRRAFWSGTPDLGASNRDKKNALIANLASWAGAKFATVQGPGLVVLQDNSENEAAQYNWVNGIVGFAVTSDWDPKSYASVRTISAAGVAIVTSNGASLSYENMASYGFYFPDGAAGVSLDAVGQTGTAVGGEVVLVTSEGANTGGATIKTDKNDYAPGTTVVMTGAGFGAGETVSLTLHEDPLVHEDRTFSATADASGAFTFSGFAPEQHHIGVRFVLTAVGQASGKRAQTTFTDGYQISVGVSATPGSSITITYRLFANNTCGGALPAAATVNVVSGGPSVVVASNLGSQQSLQLSAPSTGPNLLSFGQWTVAPINAGTPAGASTSTMCVQGNGANANNNQGSYTYTANYPVSVAATTAITSSLNPSAFGASITLTATLSPANAVGTVQFTDGGVNVGAPVTVAAGVATLTTSALNVGSHAISAVFTPGTGFTAGAVTGLTQVVDKATAVVTLGGLTATYDGSPKSVTASTMPAGLPLEITYNGLATAPTTTGAYTVIATVNSPSYQGSATGTLTIGKAAQTISFPQPANLTYGGSGLQVSGTASSNLLVTFEATGACTIATGGAQNMVSPTSAGTCTVTATQPGDANYDAAPSVQYSVIVAPRTIAIGSVTVANKPYDGNTTATITARTLADGAALSGDDVSLTGGTATFADKTVGAGKSVNVTLLALTGTHAANYALGSSSITTTASITALTVTPVVTVSNKVYDATTAATIATSDVTGKITGDVVTLSGGTAEFADKKVGSGKSVSVTGLVLSGTDGGNYTLSANTASATADITPATINGSFTAENKTYDATIAATIATRNIGSGLLLSDDVTLTGGTATFADKNVGNGKTVTGAGFALGGTDGGNYALAAVPTTTANITAAPITPVFTASNKVYDATTTATIATRSLTGKLGSDAVTLDGGTATFADKTVGTGKTVNAAGFTIIGGDATNYSLGAPASTTADITKAPITASVTASNKIYDGNATAAASPAVGGGLTGMLGTDVLSLVIGTATFDDKNVGTGKTVTVAVTLDGVDAGNYALPTPVTTTADITQKATTGSITAADKVYDGNATATIVSRTLSGTIGGDVVSLTGGSATFNDKNVGSSKPVNASGLSLTGADAGNYSLTTMTAATTASITPKQLVATATASNKLYDGLTSATAGATITGMVVGDDIAVGVTLANFADKNVGTVKTVTVNVALSGAEQLNYSLLSAAPTATADITAKGLTGGFTAASKVYDGNKAATVTPIALAGVVDGDNVTLAASSGTFDFKDVGDRTVTANLSISGGDAGNYTINPTSTAPAKITARAVTATADARSRIYGDVDPALTYQITTGSLVAGETFAGALERAPGDSVGVYAITQGSLALSDNYALTYVPANLTITPRAITVIAQAPDLTWTGSALTPAYSLMLSAGTFAPTEAIGVLGSPTYSPASVTNVGIYPITVNGLANGNYTIAVASSSVRVLDKSVPAANITELMPVPLNTAATLKVNVTDVLTGNSPIDAWKVSIDGVYGVDRPVSGGANADLTATLPGSSTTAVRRICVVGRDAAGNWSAEVCALLAIYDPNGGFVTGGGWIMSPAGAFLANPALTDKANFGFVSKYQKGNTQPSGSTEFQFKAGDINFKSTAYQWLVIAGARAQYKGDGTINGSGDYGFLLTAIDGQQNGGGGVDKFRIKIWNKSTNVIVYDNQIGAADDAVLTTTLGGGSIQIQSK